MLRALTVVLIAGCGGPPASAHGEAEGPQSVELALRRADGSFLDVGDLRGSVVVLLFMATYDAASQAQLVPLRRLAETHPDLQIIGVDIEPSARLLVGPFEQMLAPPFPIAYDPEDLVSSGRSALGSIDTVPTIVVLDRSGREHRRHVGLAELRVLETLIASAR